MAGKNKPSIYSDRSTIGSSNELDEYGVWVKSEPQDLSAVSADSQESAEASAPDMDELPDFSVDFDGGDISGLGQDDFDIPDPDAAGETAAAGQEPQDAGLDDFSIPADTELSGAGFTEVSMEDFLDGGPDLPVEPHGAHAAPAEKKSAGADLSTQLLIKIADELSSIRSELSTLKKEFSSIRREEAGADRGDGQKKGFFTEGEDEKIALTGDELDNILNTADFTEEAGADATEELPGAYPEGESGENFSSGDSFVVDEALPDILSDQDDILSGGEEAPALLLETEAGDIPEKDDIVIDLDFDTIDLEKVNKGNLADSAATPNLENFDITVDGEKITGEDSEELQLLREEGVSPMTSPPDDTSYLDEETQDTGNDAPDIFSFDAATLDDDVDLSGAVIDEPDLSGGITENPLEEPSLETLSFDDDDAGDGSGDDIHIDLDFENIDLEAHEKSESFDLDEPSDLPEEEIALSIPESSEDLDLDIPGDTSGLGSPVEEENLSIIPDGFVVEAEDSPVPLEEDLEEDVLSDGDIDTLEKSSETLDLEEPDLGLPAEAGGSGDSLNIPPDLKQGLRTVLSYMDQLLESLPEDKIEEFAKSEYFDIYKKLFKELGLD
ncbi:MAG: hypothetical protein LBK27_06105 [Treponema sp.]|jgi:hypothetical protein|nr:hypothetical protein [Treponema sp.]